MGRKSSGNLGNVLGMLLVGALGIAVLNEIATNPKVSPLWRKIATTAEGDLYQHIFNEAWTVLV
jgi:predicted ABC-type sugar transport system permease subunit